MRRPWPHHCIGLDVMGNRTVHSPRIYFAALSLVSGDKVTARVLFTGTHKGEFMGHPATGKPVKFFAIDILRIRNGKIVEDWHLEDNLTLFEQLGVVSLQE